MTHEQMQRIFNAAFDKPAPNFITSTFHRYEAINNFVVEHSSGKEPLAGSTKTVYGCTVVENKKPRPIVRHDLSKLLYSWDEVKQFMKDLQDAT